MVHILEKQENSLLNKFLGELRNIDVQKDSMRFRRNLERISEIMAYEVSKTLDYSTTVITSPLGEAPTMLPDDKIVVAPILRAAIPMMNGMLNYFDDAGVAFVSAHRHYRKKGEMEIRMEQVTTPDLEDKILIILDPMLATGASMELTYDALIAKGGVPKHTHICSVIASQDGVNRVAESLCRGRVTLWTVAVDQEMTLKSYIVPGIGDSGDLAFGEKL